MLCKESELVTEEHHGSSLGRTNYLAKEHPQPAVFLSERDNWSVKNCENSFESLCVRQLSDLLGDPV